MGSWFSSSDNNVCGGSKKSPPETPEDKGNFRGSKPMARKSTTGARSTVAPLDSIPGVPPGLEYLTKVNKLVVLQGVKLNTPVSWDCKNRFRIVNSRGQQVYCAFEEFDACQRSCCGASRGFIIHVTDNFHKEVLTLERVFKLCRRCCWCAGRERGCEHPVYVRDGRGEVLGELHTERSCCAPHYGVYDAAGTKLYDTWGPKCQTQVRSLLRLLLLGHNDSAARSNTIQDSVNVDRLFPILKVQASTDGRARGKESAVAAVSKVFGGFVDDKWVHDPDSVGLKFRLQLPARHKALMLGLTFLISLEWFQKKGRTKS